MDSIARIAEQKILEALEKGEFERLPGLGKPLVLDDDSQVPEDLRMAYRLLKNAGFLPPEAAERKEIDSLLDLLERCGDESRKLRQMRKLEALVFRMRQRPRSALLDDQDEYYNKIVSRMSLLKKS